MKGIDAIYSSDSFRAIGTAKYIADMNNLKIILDKRINERDLGIEKVCNHPKNFTVDSFNNKNLKYKNGESLNEVDKRFNDFLVELLQKDFNKIVLSIHGMLLLSFLQNNCDFSTNGKIFNIKFHGKQLLNECISNPDIYKVEYDNNKIVNISRIIV